MSRVAVSRAFNPAASLRPDKRALILKVADELNYEPDFAARSLVTRRSNLVGLIVPHLSSPWESQEIDLLTTRLQEQGFAALLLKTQPDFSMDQRLLSHLRGFNPDAVICFVENVEPTTLGQALGRATPIYISYPEDGPAPVLGTARFPIDQLAINHRRAYEQAVALVDATGVKEIAFIGGHKRSLSTLARQSSLASILAKRGHGPMRTATGDYLYEGGFRATLDLFRVGGPVQVIFAANDLMAFGAMDALRHELGLRVPDDVSVVGFDDVPQASWLSYSLSTIRLDLRERVERLVRLVLRRLAHPDGEPMVEAMSAQLVARHTIG